MENNFLVYGFDPEVLKASSHFYKLEKLYPTRMKLLLKYNQKRYFHALISAFIISILMLYIYSYCQ